jgi:hypothetical protein
MQINCSQNMLLSLGRRLQAAGAFVVAVAIAAASGCGASSATDPAAKADAVTAMRRSDSLAGGGGAGGGGTGWGTLKGKFTYNGTPPVMGVQPGFDPNKDPLCKVQVKDQSLLVDGGSKGIANVLIYLVDASRVNPQRAEATPKEAIFDQKNCEFISPLLALSTKSKLVVLNTDNTGHNTKGEPGRGNPSFNVLLEKLTGRYEYNFTAPLTMPFDATCSIHPWMKAYIVARPDPYFAVTAADGSFEIAGLPAGEDLEFQVWHERAAGDNHGLKAKPDWTSRGRFTMKIPKDGETVTLDVPVEPSSFQ